MWRYIRFPKRLKSQNVVTYCLLIATASVLFVAGCSAYRVEPDRTTYPQSLVRQEIVKVPILPGVVAGKAGAEAGKTFSHQSDLQGAPFLEYERTIIGDSATHEIRIMPDKPGAWSKTTLLAKAPNVGRQICGERYQIISTKYYKGTEATSQWLGIPHPWLNVRVRCPLDLDIRGDRRKELIVSTSREIPDADYFDIHEKDYAFGVTQLRVVVEKVLAARGMLIRKSFQSHDMDVIVTDPHRSGIIGFPIYEQLIAVLAKSDTGSILTARLLVHDLNFGSRSDTLIRNLQPVPVSRDFAYQRVGSFFGDITKALE